MGPGVRQIFVLDAVFVHELLPSPELVMFPIGIVEILIENQDRAGLKPVTQSAENLGGRRIQVTVDMGERDGFLNGAMPLRNGVAKPAFVEFHVVGHARELAAL